MKKIITLCIQLFLPVLVFSQDLVSINPSSATNGQTLNVTITGNNTHFSQASGTSVSFGFNQGSGTTVVNSINILNDTSIIANITVPANTYTGDYGVLVDNSIDGYLSLYSGFHVNGITPPSLVSINPATATNGQTLNVTITGNNTHFSQASGTSVSFGFDQGSGTTVVNSITILNDISIIANITVPANTYTDDYDVSINNSIDGYLSLYGFHVNGITPPSLVSISPATATNGQTLNVTITGANTHFSQASGTSVGFDFYQGSGTTVANSINILNDTSIIANITVPANTYTDDYDVSVSNSIDGYLSLYSGFHVNGMMPPSLVSISPAGAKPGQTLNVTITGNNTHFSQASGTYVSFSFGQVIGTIVVETQYILNDSSINILNDSSIIATITIPQNAAIGAYIAFVYNNIDGYIFNDFYVFDNCFSHYTTTYDIINNKFALTLDSVTSALATGFYWDFGDGATSTLETPIHSFTLDTVYNVCLKTTTTSGDSCSYCHEIGKDFSGQVFLKQTGFSMSVTRYDGTTGISKNEEIPSSIIAYPNPANDLIIITTKQIAATQKPILSVFSIEGQLLLQQLSTQDNTVLDISGLAKGIYFIKITSNEKVEVIKFMKQ